MKGRNMGRLTPASVGSSSGVFASTAGLSALLTAAGKPVPRQTVSLELAGSSKTVNTGTNGVAAAPFFLAQAAGSYGAAARFSGDGLYYLPSATSFDFALLKRGTRIEQPFAAVRPSETVHMTLTMTDDAGRVLLRQAEEPKTVLLELDGPGATPLASGQLSGAVVELSFDLPRPLRLSTPLRARFTGDSRYQPASSTGTLTLIDDAPPTVILDSPRGGENFSRADSIPIRFSVTDDADPAPTATAALVPLGGGQAVPVNNGSFVAASSLEPGAWTLRVSASDWAGNFTQRTTPAFFVVTDTLPPRTAIAISSPAYDDGITLWVSAGTTFTLTSIDDALAVGDAAGAGVALQTVLLDSATFLSFSNLRPAMGQAFVSSLTLAGAPDGLHALSYHAEDTLGNREAARSITVGLDAVAPSVAILAPNGLGVLAVLSPGLVPVIGTVSDPRLASWRLESAAGAYAAAGFSEIASGSSPVSAVALGTWDTARLSGWQSLRLTAADRLGNEAAARVNVFVGEPLRQLAFGGKALLNKPEDAVSAEDGTIFVADRNDDAVVVFSSTGAFLSRLSSGELNKGQAKKSGLLTLNKPSGLAIDGSQAVWVADTNDNRAVRISTLGAALGTIDGLSKPADIVVDAAGNLYVSETEASRVRKFNSAGGALLTFPLPGSSPAGIALDSHGFLYVADATGNRIAVFDPAGALVRSLAPGLDGPTGVAVSADGESILIADTGGNRLLKVDRHGNVNLRLSYAPESPAAFNKPAGLFLDAAGRLLLADRNNDRVVRLASPDAPPMPSVIASRGSRWQAKGRLSKTAGGRVERQDGAAVEVPPGALREDVEIEVSTPIVRSELEENVKTRARGNAALVSVSSGVEYGPEGVTFELPVTIAIPYDPAAVAKLGAPETELRIYYWNRKAQRWEGHNSTVDPVNHVVTAQTAHFSLYEVLGPSGSAGESGGGRETTAAADPSFVFRDAYAFPNPSRRSERPTIRAQVGLADELSVSIFDLSGRNLRRASMGDPKVIDDGNGKGPQYTYDYQWDTGGIGSGIYFYSITATKAGAAPIRRSGRVGVIK